MVTKYSPKIVAAIFQRIGGYDAVCTWCFVVFKRLTVIASVTSSSVKGDVLKTSGSTRGLSELLNCCCCILVAPGGLALSRSSK